MKTVVAHPSLAHASRRTVPVTALVPAASGLALALLSGCSLESLLVEGTDTDHQRPRTTLRGTVNVDFDFRLEAARFEILTADGTEVEIFDRVVEGNFFDLGLAEAEYPNARLSITFGERNLLALVPLIKEVDGESVFDEDQGKTPTSIEVSVDSTVAALATTARVTSLGRNFQSVDASAMDNTVALVLEEVNTSTLAQVKSTVTELLNRADTSDTSTNAIALFQWPEFQPSGAPLTGSLVEGAPALEEAIMVGSFPPSTGDTTRFRFDQLLEQSIAELRIQECLDPERIRVVLEVNFNAGRIGGVCNDLNRFKWVRDEPGKQMFFVGGIHETSPVQDPELDAAFGNNGSWTPNTVPMFDDGTNGDETAGDNVWTITYDLPRGLRIGYKFTWGQRGALWTGAEEWPGNQRLLEVIDVNGDGIVYRQDNFGDEGTNKDFSNDRNSVGNEVTWDTDGDGDGIFDPRERHDLDNDCSPDPIRTPTGVGPATVPPEDGICPEL